MTYQFSLLSHKTEQSFYVTVFILPVDRYAEKSVLQKFQT